ncbi:hypothetical protein J3E68DRAFT_414255 [Trichoderma sp. SZMC 28012]
MLGGLFGHHWCLGIFCVSRLLGWLLIVYFRRLVRLFNMSILVNSRHSLWLLHSLGFLGNMLMLLLVLVLLFVLLLLVLMLLLMLGLLSGFRLGLRMLGLCRNSSCIFRGLSLFLSDLGIFVVSFRFRFGLDFFGDGGGLI